MKPVTRALFLSMLSAVATTMPASYSAQTPPHAGGHHIVQSPDVKWRPLRPGAEIAVVAGDPDKAGAEFVIRMRYQGVVRVPPHWHPNDEHITVLSGRFIIGMGERADESKTIELGAGGYAMMPAKLPHYAWSKGDTVVQVHGLGPFSINYVNPADAPSEKAKGQGKGED